MPWLSRPKRAHAGRIVTISTSLALAMLPAIALTTTAATGPVASSPTVRMRVGTTLSTSRIPLAVSWPVASSADAPLAGYELQTRRDGRSWTPVTLSRPLARSVTVRVRPWAVLEFRVRAFDTIGAVSAWAASEPVWLSVIQESDPELELSSGWQIMAAASAFGGRRSITTTKGSTATLGFTGRTIAWVTRFGPVAGEADVALDGVHATHLDMSRSTWRPRRIAYVASWPTAGEHELAVTATESEAFAEVDAFIVLDVVRDATLVGAGDIASCSRSDDEATAAVAAAIPGTVFTTGDNVYPDGSAANFTNCYEPSWGTLKARTRPVAGNHEYVNNPGAAAYFNYFGLAAGEPGKGWYRYEAGTWRVYALNSECTTSLCQQQLDWLEADLVGAPHRCVLAMWHRPRFSTGEHGDSTRMASAWQLLHEHGAEVVLAGHDHGYQRYIALDGVGIVDPAQGIRQFVVATGGASLYDFETDSANVAVRDNTSHGVLRLNLYAGSYSWQFLPVPGDDFTDAGTGTCH